DSDLTGNGVNHPNDFGHRVYAQVLASLLLHPDTQYGRPVAAVNPADRPAVLLMGDSIRLSYTEGVRAGLADAAQVVSPAANGGDSSNVRKNLSAWIGDCSPRFVLINSGIHDTKLFNADQRFQVPPEEYVANWKAIFAELRRTTSAEIVFVTSTPILDDRAAAARSDRDYHLTNAAIEQYNALAVEVAADSGVAVLDLNSALCQSTAPLGDLLAADGVHLTESGKTLAVKLITDYVQEQLR
ncbi:MAG: hypothetical protein KDA85_17865, partial [Planctomycetaceae bacterium]|nr:hypothetical protein [Planctomycetaceae bacterium]